MGILDRLSDWLDLPSQPYHCERCENRFEEPRSTCPDCGGDVRMAPSAEYPYWEPF